MKTSRKKFVLEELDRAELLLDGMRREVMKRQYEEACLSADDLNTIFRRLEAECDVLAFPESKQLKGSNEPDPQLLDGDSGINIITGEPET